MPPPNRTVHPLKGPMVTQSLRGIADSGPLHWRGDRNGINSGATDPDPFDEGQAFMHFRAAFQGLLGSTGAKVVRRSQIPVLVIR